VAHDFNNLLAVILNYASFVDEELTQAASTTSPGQWDGALSDVHQIQVAAERASELTHQLLSFARREVVQARELNLNDAIIRMEQSCAERSASRSNSSSIFPTTMRVWWPIRPD